tara:strand:- start:30 stop:239 length:210 start_codon:yes stop_codon:yes gene_type:complete
LKEYDIRHIYNGKGSKMPITTYLHNVDEITVGPVHTLESGCKYRVVTVAGESEYKLMLMGDELVLTEEE